MYREANLNLIKRAYISNATHQKLIQSKRETQSNELQSFQKQSIKKSTIEKESSETLPAELSAPWFGLGVLRKTPNTRKTGGNP